MFIEHLGEDTIHKRNDVNFLKKKSKAMSHLSANMAVKIMPKVALNMALVSIEGGKKTEREERNTLK